MPSIKIPFIPENPLINSLVFFIAICMPWNEQLFFIELGQEARFAYFIMGYGVSSRCWLKHCIDKEQSSYKKITFI